MVSGQLSKVLSYCQGANVLARQPLLAKPTLTLVNVLPLTLTLRSTYTTLRKKERGHQEILSYERLP